jgi:hypothetical protein
MGHQHTAGRCRAGWQASLHFELSGRFEGQIDASGSLKGYYQGTCVFELAWQRR